MSHFPIYYNSTKVILTVHKVHNVVVTQASSMKAGDAVSEADGPSITNIEGQQYVEAMSYVILEINLNRPLVPKRPPEELAKR